MTICIGLFTQEGIVIAADAQESDAYFKRPQQKILTFTGPVIVGGDHQSPQLACAFTGAGDAGYLDAFFDYAIREISTNVTQREFQDYLDERVKVFYERHIFPLAVAADPPEIEMLIGAFCRYQTCMFVTHGSTVRRAFPHGAVGAGAHFALGLINELPRPKDIRHAEILAAYVIGLTKESIEHCGKYTAIVSLHNSSVSEATEGKGACLVPPEHPLTFVAAEKIRRWEDSFGNRWAPRQNKLIEEMMEEELGVEESK
jgi:hypothetical protein